MPVLIAIESQRDYLIPTKIEIRTTSRQACKCCASESSREDILFALERPLAKAMTQSLVLVSPSTCQKAASGISEYKIFSISS